MKKNIIAMVPVAALLTGGMTALSAENSGSVPVPPASEFNAIQRYAISYDDPRDVAEFYLRDYGFKPRHAEFEEVAHPSDRSMRIVLVTVDGLADDSVKGVQWRFGMRTSEGNWEAVEAGMRRMCYRGENAGSGRRRFALERTRRL